MFAQISDTIFCVVKLPVTVLGSLGRYLDLSEPLKGKERKQSLSLSMC
jgi:hypothetical protein